MRQKILLKEKELFYLCVSQEGVSSASMKMSAAVKSFSGAFSSKVSKVIYSICTPWTYLIGACTLLVVTAYTKKFLFFAY